MCLHIPGLFYVVIYRANAPSECPEDMSLSMAQKHRAEGVKGECPKRMSGGHELEHGAKRDIVCSPKFIVFHPGKW